MVSLVERMPRPLAQTSLVREQLGLALNRLKRREAAERVLLTLMQERGPSSETYGILGRVYKDGWDYATRLELAVLAKDEAAANQALASALARVRENWEPESTANNLKLIRGAREHRGRSALDRDDRVASSPQGRSAVTGSAEA